MTIAPPDAIMASIERAFAAPPRLDPYPHWLLDEVLPDGMAARLAGMHPPGEAIGDGGGRRENSNDRRIFLGPDMQRRNPDCGALAAALQTPHLAATLARNCGADLDGALLRIEYCRDRGGFWLEPHTDIGAKRFTFLIYLNTPPAGEQWGTDIYRDAAGSFVGSAPSHENAGVAFVPAANSWHGFAPRPISAERRSLIINYVGPEWRSTHELAFADQPIRLA